MAPAPHLIAGTAGHVDHGKTTLVKALTGVDLDTLPEEKTRGLTIALGFTHLDLPSGLRIGIVDVPGHHRFIKTMLAGAHGLDFVLFLIACDDSVMPQTREHLAILRLLGIQRGIVVLTKRDLVDDEMFALVETEVEELTRGTFLEKAPRVAASRPGKVVPLGPGSHPLSSADAVRVDFGKTRAEKQAEAIKATELQADLETARMEIAALKKRLEELEASADPKVVHIDAGRKRVR